MKLKKVSIKGLNNKVDCDWDFHDDINIVTGINGCGKTTFLKMLWYAISGNIECLISEISFKSFNLETSNFTLLLIRKKSSIEWQYSANEIQQNGDFSLVEFNPVGGIEVLQSLILESSELSLFFPTFRRIEGGYSVMNPKSTSSSSNSSPTLTSSSNFTPPSSLSFLEKPKPIGLISSFTSYSRSNSIKMVRAESNRDTSIKNAFDKLSNHLSMSGHKFICSISTHDLGLLLNSRYIQISAKTNEEFLKFSALMSSQIENIESDIVSGKQDALDVLSRLQQENNAVNNIRKELLRPFEVLAELVIKVMHYKGVRLDDFILGESNNAIDSRLLSSGEQQMLSFLCYNAFYENSVIFIDEPELSLHPDWQRRLFPNLMKQQSSNQFVVATHSPMIYSKYSDKEIILSSEKGE
jgi:predicted ATPase